MKTKHSHGTIFLLLHSAIVLLISYVIVLYFIPSTKLLSFFSVIEESGDIPMSDMYMYINFRKGPAKLNTDITLVSIDSCRDRFEIAKVIEKVDSLHPKAIGLDVLFKDRKEPEVDAVLENVIRKCKNLVVACILDAEHREDNTKYDVCNRSFFAEQDNSNITEGFINLDSDGSSPVRTFTSKLYLQKEKSLDTLYSFDAQIVKLCDETVFQKLLQRGVNLEVIHYQPLRFYEIDRSEIDDDPELITDKIVFIGSLSSLSDSHRTSINSEMLGLEIHAQIISTIFEEKYINSLDNVWTRLMNVLFCYLFTLFCWVAMTKIKEGVELLIKVAQIAILFIAFFAGYYLFNHYNIDIAYAQTIVVMGIVILIIDIYHVGISFGSKYILKHKKINQNE